MPARKKERKKRLNKKSKNNKTRIRKILILAVLAILFAVLFWIFVMPNTWDKSSRLALAIKNSTQNDDVSILIFDPQGQSITTIAIPPNTEVASSNNLGTWPLGSITTLAENESLDGSLLSKTLTKTFKFPIEHWASSKALGFSNGGVSAVIAGISPYDTSLTLKDRISLAIFAFKFQASEKIDLAQTPILTKVKLKGGDSGYRVRDNSANLKLAKIFSVPEISQTPPKIKILSTGRGSSVENISQTIEVLGAKTYSVGALEVGADQIDCEIRAGKESLASKLISNIYDCKFKETELTNFDIEIALGEKFFARF